eukprot:scaffold10570_cov176-Amphora_coffeaeformis.AAC.43
MEATNRKIRLVLLFLSLVCVSYAFLAPQTPTGILLLPSSQGRQAHLSRAPSSAIFLASESPRRRRRKRTTAEVSQQDDEKEEEAPPAAVRAPPQPRPDAPVALAVTDIRNLVGGGSGGGSTGAASTTATSTTNKSATSSTSSVATTTTTSTSTSSPVTASSLNSVAPSTSNDALEQMLMDAKAMQGDDEVSSSSTGSDEPSIPKIISSVLGTIVTVDFFIVCGFLLWFLTGIFSSYVLKNDDIQIAFNNNFETLVQPALGILMIAAVAGNFFKDEEQEL